MNPLLAKFYASVHVDHELNRPLQAPSAALPQSVAAASDRAYIEAHAEQFQHNPEIFAYDRAPLTNEWTTIVPAGAFVRVFVINEWTTVRVLHGATGGRIAEPVMDTWRGMEPWVAN